MSHSSPIDLHAWLEEIPKLELHLHVEGAIPEEVLWELIQKYGGDPEVPDREALGRRFRYRDFRHFLDVWTWKNGFLREEEDFTLLARAVAQDLVKQNVLRAELFFSSPDFYEIGLTTQGIATALRRGFDRVPGVEVALICDVVRDFGPELAESTLDAVLEVRDQGVVGIGLGGSEHKFPARPFHKVFHRAKEAGLYTTAHAGEAAGPSSVWSALRDLEVDRIGHGIAAAEDPQLVRHLAERQVPLEICPFSNLATGVVPSIAEHPIGRLLEEGVRVTVNTDDPTLFQTRLALEYRSLVEELGFTAADIRRLVMNAVHSTWLRAPERRQLKEAVEGHPAWSLPS